MANAYEEAAPSRADVLNLEFPDEMNLDPAGVAEFLRRVVSKTEVLRTKEERLRKHYTGEARLRRDQVRQTESDYDQIDDRLRDHMEVLKLFFPEYPWGTIVDQLDGLDIGDSEDQIAQIRQSS